MTPETWCGLRRSRGSFHSLSIGLIRSIIAPVSTRMSLADIINQASVGFERFVWRYRYMMRLLKSALVVCLFAVSVFAQSNQGTITGTISDPAGAVVPGAQVEVKNNDSGVVYRGGSSATGNFVIQVHAGTY